MPAAKDRQETRSEELSEFPITGPFGGTQSELPPTEIEDFGFVDTTNFLFRKGAAYVRPGYTALPIFPAPAGEPILAVADFYNVNGAHIQCVITPTRLLEWIGGGWTNITGPGFTGSPTQLFSWDVVNYKLCFSQGVDKVFTWDGIAASYVQSSANAPAARYVAEIGLHVMTLNTVEGGVSFPNRYRWSGAGDPTDWISFNAGLSDQLNNLGPGNGLIKLGQYGFGLHQNGVVEVVPTGNGVSPFAFYPIINAAQGLICPHALAHLDDQGQELAVYPTVDNVVVFNGASIDTIGDRPIDGRRRQGARSRIYADIVAANPLNCSGFTTYSINGQIFKAYWLVIPNGNMTRIWVYNFDEGNWTSFSLNGYISTIGIFSKQSAIRIIDLVGQILGQSWTPATLVATNPFEGLLLGFNNGVAGYVDFTNYSELSAQLISGKHIFHDRRHKKTVKKYRLVVLDLGQTSYTITLTNERRYSQTKVVTIGNGSGDVLSYVQEFTITGLRIQHTVSVPANSPGVIVELAPMYDTSGEQRGGTADGN